MPEQQQPPPEPQPLVCVHCGTPLRGYYEIKHVHPSGKVSPKLVRACSVLCIIQWAYKYGLVRGMQGFAMVKQMIETVRGQKP